MIVRPGIWMGGVPLIGFVFFLVFALVAIAVLIGVGVLVWRAASRSHQASTPPPGYAQAAGPGPGRRTSPMTPVRTIEERLADLDDLHSRGVISDEERRDARAKIISES